MRTTTVTLTLALGLALAGCSTDSTDSGDGATDATTAEGAAAGTEDAGTTDAAGQTDSAAGTDAAEAPMDDPVCAEFFTDGAVKLADRAEKDRDLLESGETLDPASFGEVNLLAQRLRGLVESAEGDQATLLERINAPFEEASEAVLDDPDKDPTDAEITLPEIDVADAAAAQEELLAACTG